MGEVQLNGIGGSMGKEIPVHGANGVQTRPRIPCIGWPGLARQYVHDKPPNRKSPMSQLITAHFNSIPSAYGESWDPHALKICRGTGFGLSLVSLRSVYGRNFLQDGSRGRG